MPRPEQSTGAPGNWERTTILLCGASGIGKSYALLTMLIPEYGAQGLIIDRVYTEAARAAGLFEGPDRTAAAKLGRRQARDRRFRREGAEEAFFRSYDQQVRAALQAALEAAAPLVVDGGTLRRADEVERIAAAAREVHGRDARVVRFALSVSYETWLRGRVDRAVRRKHPSIDTARLSRARYASDMAEARAEPADSVLDYEMTDAEQIRYVMAELDRAAGNALQPATSSSNKRKSVT